MERKRIEREERAFTWVARGLGIAGLLALPGACGDDVVPPDAARLGALSRSELKAVCDELRAESAGAEQAACGDPADYVELQPQPAPCEDIQAGACDSSVGELRACVRATAADPCGLSPDPARACAPLVQHGCASEFQPFWATECPELGALVAPFEGIYEIVEHTRSRESCAEQGESVLSADAQRYLVVVPVILYGAPLGWLESCSDLADCRTAADELRRYSRRTDLQPGPDPAPQLSDALVCHASVERALAWSRVTSTATPTPEGDCGAEQTEGTLSRAGEGTLQLSGRTTPWERASDGTCGPAPADGSGCAQLEVYAARFVAAL